MDEQVDLPPALCASRDFWLRKLEHWAATEEARDIEAALFTLTYSQGPGGPQSLFLLSAGTYPTTATGQAWGYSGLEKRARFPTELTVYGGSKHTFAHVIM